jgi:hypothetical protein
MLNIWANAPLSRQKERKDHRDYLTNVDFKLLYVFDMQLI